MMRSLKKDDILLQCVHILLRPGAVPLFRKQDFEFHAELMGYLIFFGEV